MHMGKKNYTVKGKQYRKRYIWFWGKSFPPNTYASNPLLLRGDINHLSDAIQTLRPITLPTHKQCNIHSTFKPLSDKRRGAHLNLFYQIVKKQMLHPLMVNLHPVQCLIPRPQTKIIFQHHHVTSSSPLLSPCFYVFWCTAYRELSNRGYPVTKVIGVEPYLRNLR